MDYYKYLIIGSGPAGISAALKLEGDETCLIDVGEESSSNFSFSYLSEALQSGMVEKLLGKHWEFLSNLREPFRIHPKLRAEDLRHVATGEPFQVFDQANEPIVSGRGSFAAGGMGNVWGAQLLRYTEEDLSEIGGYRIWG